MRWKLHVSMLILGLVVLASCSRVNLEMPGLVKVSRHVYAFVASGPSADEGLGANSGFIVGTDGVLIVDTRYTTTLARELLAAVRSVTDAELLYVVNTHYHPDHVWGNSVFREEGARIISRAETRRDIEKYSPIYLEYYRERSKAAYEKIKDIEVVLPDTTFDDGLSLDLGGVEVVLHHFGPAHTPGDCIVTVPSERIAFTGGVVSNGYHPNLGDPGADFDNWLEALNRLEGMGLRYIIPGQGYVCKPDVINAQIDYIITLRDMCIRAIKGGVPMETAMKAITIDGTEGYLQKNLLAFNVQAVCRREIPAIVKPDFEFDLPEGYTITDGGGSPTRGMIKWSRYSDYGILIIKVKWWRTAPVEIIPQDIFDHVSREAASIEPLRMEVSGSKMIEMGGESEIAGYGRWVYEREGRIEGLGPWTWVMLQRKDTIYLIQLSANAEGIESKEKKIMEELGQIVKTFKTVESM